MPSRDKVNNDTQKQEAEQRDLMVYRKIVETAQEGIWTIDENEKTNFVNQKMASLLGYTIEEMMGKKLYEFMDEEAQENSKKHIERRKKGETENLDVRYITKSGESIWTNVSANPILDENGNYIGSLAMVTDITHRKADEEALRKSEANLRTIFDNTDSAYILFDAKMRIVSFNALAQKYSEQQNNKKLVVNSDISDYFSKERWPFIQQTLNNVAKGETASYELSFKRPNGVTEWYEVRWLNVKNSDNKNWGFILANNNITETKTAALEREKITADLIQHNNDLEQFTYIVSHNLRAPVANIIGLSDMLKEGGLDPSSTREIIDKVSASVKNIDVIINDLNHILQARDPMNERKEIIYFENIADAIKTSIHNTVVNENVQLTYSFDEIGSMFTIRSYLYSIFYNLVSNSIKYRRKGVIPEISIKSHKSKDKLELRFKDNGKGIDLDKNRGLVFGLYKRFDTSVEGKGMGLFMVKTHVEAMGGTIKIKSKLGEGTEFIIQFGLATVLPVA